MPFVARRKDTGERVDITALVNPKAAFKRGEIVCQLCGQDMTVRGEHSRAGGVRVSAHFTHIGECDQRYDAHPESPEHLAAKLYIRDQLRTFYAEWSQDVHIELEVPIPMDWRARGRIADVCVMWPTGWYEVHEAQLAGITPARLKERTNDYARAGCDVTWWIGGRAYTEGNWQWLYARDGFVNRLHFDMQRDDRDLSTQMERDPVPTGAGERIVEGH